MSKERLGLNTNEKTYRFLTSRWIAFAFYFFGWIGLSFLFDRTISWMHLADAGLEACLFGVVSVVIEGKIRQLKNR